MGPTSISVKTRSADDDFRRVRGNHVPRAVWTKSSVRRWAENWKMVAPSQLGEGMGPPDVRTVVLGIVAVRTCLLE